MSKKLQSAIDKGLDGDAKAATKIIMDHLREIDHDEELIAKLEKDVETYRALLKKAAHLYAVGDTGHGNTAVAQAKVLLTIVHEDDKALEKEEKHLK